MNVFEISIHALREESDQLHSIYAYGAVRFQSTLSVRRATLLPYDGQQFFRISIHALREESDAVLPQKIRYIEISIHALREESDNLPEW